VTTTAQSPIAPTLDRLVNLQQESLACRADPVAVAAVVGSEAAALKD
jgi:hypothetical protein